MNEAIRRAVFKRDRGLCRYCGAVPKPYNRPVGFDRYLLMSGWEIDHVLPKSRGGTDDLENLVLACADCNRTKYANAWVPIPLDEVWDEDWSDAW